MFSKFKVFLLTGFFLLIATASFAEPFWYFHTGHTIKYTRAKANGTDWTVTMTIVANGQTQCGRDDYNKVDEYNYDNDGQTKTKYFRVTENAGYRCDGGEEYKFFQVGLEGTTWTYPDPLGDDGVQFKVVSNTRFGALITIRRLERSGGNWGKEEYMLFHKGYGKYRDIDYIGPGDDNPPWVQARHGYRGSTVYATFSDGLYVYDYDGKSTWTRISSVPANIVTLGPNVYATWPGQGLYVWDGNVWTRISSVPAMMVPANSKLYATWIGQGLYSWNGSGWTRISSVPDKMVAAGKYLYASWAGQGLYKWDGVTWTRISSVPGNVWPGQLSGQ